METLFQKEAMIPYENLKNIVDLYANISLYISIKYYNIYIYIFFYIIDLHREWHEWETDKKREIALVNTGTLKTVKECFDLIKWQFYGQIVKCFKLNCLQANSN